MFKLTRTLQSVRFTDIHVGRYCGDAAHNENLSESRDVDAVLTELIQSLMNFMESRLPDKEFANLEPLRELKFNISDDALRKYHAIIIPDMLLCDFIRASRKLHKS